MDYERKYKETIDKLRKLHNDWASTQNRAAKEIELTFPELRESEDERIRNEIIAFVKQSIHRGGGTPIPQEQEDKWIAWLEKQGKNNPEEWSFPYNVDETVDKLMAIAECLEMDGDCLFNGYTGTGCGKFLRDLARKQVECNPAEWSEEDIRNIQDIDSILFYDRRLTEDIRKRLRNFLESLKNKVQPQSQHIIESLLESLQQEQPKVDLEKALSRFTEYYAHENSGEYPSAIDIARYFYELGLKVREEEQ